MTDSYVSRIGAVLLSMTKDDHPFAKTERFSEEDRPIIGAHLSRFAGSLANLVLYMEDAGHDDGIPMVVSTLREIAAVIQEADMLDTLGDDINEIFATYDDEEEEADE